MRIKAFTNGANKGIGDKPCHQKAQEAQHQRHQNFSQALGVDIGKNPFQAIGNFFRDIGIGHVYSLEE